MELTENEYITVKVQGPVEEIHFRVKKTTEIRKIKKSYSERVGLPIEKLTYFFNGQLITDYDTPSGLAMAEDYILVVMEEGLPRHCVLCARSVERLASLRLHYAQEHYYPEGSFQEFIPQGGVRDALRFYSPF